MTERKTFIWFGILNAIILIAIWLFHLKEDLPILLAVVLIPNIIGILIVYLFEKKSKSS